MHIDTAALKSCLDRLAADYDARFLDSDPVGLVHAFTDPRDIEVAGAVAAMLAYGGVRQIRGSVSRVLDLLGPSPADFAACLGRDDALALFRDFRHRWTSGGDAAFLVWVLGEAIREHGSIGGLVRSLDDPDAPTVEPAMTGFADWVRARYDPVFGDSRGRTGISYLVPSPAGGSACKRLAMYFRWMVRGPDSIDFGLWRFIDPARLVIPVDRHIARMAALLDLTRRRSPDWKMALEITASLRRLDPRDPLRYDFALVRPGILRECSPAVRGACPGCLLKTVCREAE